MSAALQMLHTAETATVPCGRQELEERLNRANALVFLMATSLMHFAESSDSVQERGGSTACGLIALEGDLRKELAQLI